MGSKNLLLTKLPPKTYLSPSTVIIEFKKLTDKFGDKAVIFQRRFQIAREMRVAALLALSSYDYNKTLWYLKPSYDTAPDILMINYSKGENRGVKGLVRNELNLEVFDLYDDWIELVDIVKNKIKKGYPKDYAIVGYVWRKVTSFDFDRVITSLREVSEGRRIALIFKSESPVNGKNISMIEINPVAGMVEYNLNELVHKVHALGAHIHKSSFGIDDSIRDSNE